MIELPEELKRLLDSYGNQAWKWGHATAVSNEPSAAAARAACIQARAELTEYIINN